MDFNCFSSAPLSSLCVILRTLKSYLLDLDAPVKPILLAWKQAKGGNKNQSCHCGGQQDVLWVWSSADSGSSLEVKSVTAISWVTRRICFFLKSGSSIQVKRGAALSGPSALLRAGSDLADMWSTGVGQHWKGESARSSLISNFRQPCRNAALVPPVSPCSR